MALKRMLTRDRKKKVLQDESQFNCMTSEEKGQLLKLCESPKKRKSEVEDSPLQDSPLQDSPLQDSPLQESHLKDKDRFPSLLKTCSSNFEWIMCDDCQKWRKISCKDAEAFHGSREWFCSLNKDPEFNKCFQPEECYSDFMKLIRQEDLLVVIFGLKLGDLVLGKMQSFSKWPAIITCDPLSGDYVSDQTNYKAEYHLEFLGEKHSHAWITGTCIEIYCKTEFTKNLLSTKKKMKKVKFQTTRDVKQYYDLQSAIKEANSLVDVTNSRRMEWCVFGNADGKEFIAAAPRESRKYMQSPIDNSTNKVCEEKDSPKVQICSKPDRCCILPSNSTLTADSSEQVEPSVIPGCNNTDHKSSLLTLTPQQRFCLDIEVYKKSEVAFTIDLKQFLARNNLHLETTYWENVPVNTYQFFQAVNEFGGYEKVTKKSKWSYIYQELTNTHERYRGKLARMFYYRYLYAYSLYVLGKDYEHIIQDILKQEKKKGNCFVLKKTKKKIVKHKPKPKDDDFLSTLNKKFEELEELNRMCYFEEDSDMNSSQEELGIHIPFHEESEPFNPSLEYESPLIDSAVSDDRQAQINKEKGYPVPDIYAFHGSSDNSSKHSGADHDNASKHLEDLHTLSDQI